MTIIVDRPVIAIMYTVKVLRFMTMWIALYIADKVFQSRYVSRVLFERMPPPTLVGLVATALAIESVAVMFVMIVLWLLKVQNKRAHSSFVIDSGLMVLVAGDYLVTTAVFFAIGVALCATASSRRLFRYGEDGLRGIRAVSLALLGIAGTVVLLLPAFVIIK